MDSKILLPRLHCPLHGIINQRLFCVQVTRLLRDLFHACTLIRQEFFFRKRHACQFGASDDDLHHVFIVSRCNQGRFHVLAEIRVILNFFINLFNHSYLSSP